MDEQVRRLLTLCAIRVDGKSLDWSLLARTAQAGLIGELWEGRVPPQEPASTRTAAAALLQQGLRALEDASERVDAELEIAAQSGAQLLTVLHPEYPANLRLVRDLPPFLFALGSTTSADNHAVAIVGTRQASEDGLRRAARLAKELTHEGVTVVSGLARGIDTAAHEAALQQAGRTIAVIGTGISHCYPPENRTLAERISRAGAVISQFWPSRRPGRDTFPRRNRVTSGVSIGSAVIEASSTSGAKMQARLAFEHGKKVWLLASLVDNQEWARRMVDLGRARVIHTTDDILTDLNTTPASLPTPAQETLELQ